MENGVCRSLMSGGIGQNRVTVLTTAVVNTWRRLGGRQSGSSTLVEHEDAQYECTNRIGQ